MTLLKNPGRVLSLVLVFLALSGASASASVSASVSGTKWRGNYFPDVPLVTQDGKRVRFYEDLIKNKVVAISFIFTRCNGPCPAETANLRQVEKLLGDRVGRDVFMYSISVDPENDTPKALKEYAKKFNAGPGWTFLTGKEDDIVLLRRKLGVYSASREKEKLEDHDVRFVVGNEATGQWMKRSPFDHPKVLARVLGTSLQSMPVTQAGQASYARAPRVPVISKGEGLFRSRCSSCHSLDARDGVGPGLAGVTVRRKREWLHRWLKNPDQLLAKKDPIATALFEKFRKLPMPNFDLSDGDVEALISFLEKPGASVM